MSWLYETKTSVLIVLGVGLALSVLIYSKNRNRKSTIAVGVSIALLLLYFLIGWLVESDREKAERSLREMVAKIDQSTVNEMFEHVDEGFSLGQLGWDKAEFQRYAKRVIPGRNIRNARISNLKVKSFDSEQGKIVFTFTARAEANVSIDPIADVEATFVRGTDDKWRMQTFEIFQFGSTNKYDLGRFRQ